MERTGKAIVVAGIIIAAIGVIVWLAGDKLRFLGRLPGDLRYDGEHTRIYIPFTTMLLLSMVFSLVLWIIQKLR
ncbi:MAG: DUF2905 domain-containing protein [Bacteroidota bacterium]